MVVSRDGCGKRYSRVGPGRIFLHRTEWRGLDQRLRSVPTGGRVDFILVEVAENAAYRWPERKYSAPELADYRLAFTSSPRGPVHLYRQTPATR